MTCFFYGVLFVWFIRLKYFTVGELFIAIGMLYEMNLSPFVLNLLIPSSAEHYLQNTLLMLRSSVSDAIKYQASGTELNMIQLRKEICTSAHSLYSNSAVISDWEFFLEHAIRTIM